MQPVYHINLIYQLHRASVPYWSPARLGAGIFKVPAFNSGGSCYVGLYENPAMPLYGTPAGDSCASCINMGISK